MSEKMCGAWKILDIPACNLPQAVATGFCETIGELIGAQYTPVLYCATQIVAGTNHMLICKQRIMNDSFSEALVEVYLHQSLPTNDNINGVFTILSIRNIDIGI